MIAVGVISFNNIHDRDIHDIEWLWFDRLRGCNPDLISLTEISFSRVVGSETQGSAENMGEVEHKIVNVSQKLRKESENTKKK